MATTHKERNKLLSDDNPKVYINDALPIMARYSWRKVTTFASEAKIGVDGRPTTLMTPKWHYAFEQTIIKRFNQEPHKKSGSGFSTQSYIIPNPEHVAVFPVPTHRVTSFAGTTTTSDKLLEGSDYVHGTSQWRVAQADIQKDDGSGVFIQTLRLVCATREILDRDRAEKFVSPALTDLQESTELD